MIKQFFKNIKIVKYVTLLQKYNKLQIDYEVLKNAAADDSFNKLLSQITAPEEIEKLRKENKRLREKIKVLKEIIKGGE